MNRRNQRGWQFDLTSAGIGSLLTLGVVAAAGASVVAMTPRELYRAAPATVRPVPGPRVAIGPHVELPPCTGSGKDCSEPERPAALPESFVWTYAIPEFTPVPLPHTDNERVRYVPEPGTLALLAVGAGVAAWRKRK